MSSVSIITEAMQENNAATGFRVVATAYLGDGTGVVVADKLNRLAYYWQPAVGGSQRVVSTAVLWSNANIPFADIPNGLQIPVDLGYPPGDNRLHILQQAGGGSGMAATGGVTALEQRISQASFPPIANIQDFRASVLDSGEVYIAPGTYRVPSTGLLQRFYGKDTSRADTTVNARITALSSGQHQLLKFCLDLATGNLKTVVGTATTAVQAYPASKAEFFPAAFTAITTPYYVLGVLYIRKGQTPTNDDLYREWDGRFSLDNSTILQHIAPSTYKTLQDMQNVVHSAGWVAGGAVTDNGDGTVAVAAGSGLIHPTDSATTTLYFFDWSADTSISLTNNDDNWIYIDYNAGAPIAVASTSSPVGDRTKIILAYVYRNGTELHINDTWRWTVGDHANLMMWEMAEVMPFARVSGGMISGSNRDILITSGVWWHGLTRFTTSSFDSSGVDTFNSYYRNGSGGWTEVTAQSEVNNTQYDDGSGTLATLTANRYGVHWVYLATDDDVHVVFGQGDYTLALAQEAQPPASIPPELTVDSTFVGKIIIQKSAASFESVESPFTIPFVVSGGSAGANTALSNLASVAINTTLISDTDITDDLGSNSLRWKKGYIQTIVNDTQGLPVRNSSGASVAVNDCGYMQYTATYGWEFKTTTTANLVADWCVVVDVGASGNDGTTIYVATSGIVTVVLNANCSIGNYLTTSTTAKRAAVSTIMRPEIFAVALTANAGGAGGTCTAQLLCKSNTVGTTNTNDIYRAYQSSATGWTGTINGAPTATSVVVTTSTGNLNTVKPFSTTQLWKARLFNITRGTYRLVTNVSGSTITTVSSTDTWANTDSLTIASQTITGAPSTYIDLDASQQTAIPANTRYLIAGMFGSDTGATATIIAHPFEAYVASKTIQIETQVAGKYFFSTTPPLPLLGGLFGFSLAAASGTGTGDGALRLNGYIEAVP